MVFMGYGICRIQKINNGLGGIRSHMRREHESHTNPDIDYQRSSSNYVIQCSAEHLEKRINQRISELNLKRKPRKDAVKLLDCIITASPEDMKSFSTEQQQNFFQKSLAFLKNEYGEQNLMYCEVHLDEETPHAHIGFVPVTPDGRLCADELMKRGKLHELQNKFYKAVSSQFGLERGEIGTKRKHIETARLKADIAKKQEEKSNKYVQEVLSEIDVANVSDEKIKRIRRTVQYKQQLLGLFEDKTKVEIPTKAYNDLVKITKESAKSGIVVREALQNADEARSQLQVARKQNQELENKYAKKISDLQDQLADYKRYTQKLNQEAKLWLTIPDYLQNHVQWVVNIARSEVQQTIRDVNKLCGAMYIMQNGNSGKVCSILHGPLQMIRSDNKSSYVRRCGELMIKQLKNPKKYKPKETAEDSWNSPPECTNYLESLYKHSERVVQHVLGDNAIQGMDLGINAYNELVRQFEQGLLPLSKDRGRY